MLLATLGLIAFSLVTLDTATATDVPGSPDYFVIRQALYAVVGLALMLAARLDRLLPLPGAAHGALRGR